MTLGLTSVGPSFSLLLFLCLDNTMSIFDALFGRKPPELKTIPRWEDTDFPEPEQVVAHTTFGKPMTELNLNAVWPFPTVSTGPRQTSEGVVTAETEKEQTPRIVNTNQIAQYHAEQSAWRRAEKARLKEIVQAAPEHGIEFVHVGTTTFAWRYHSEAEEGYQRNKLLIDISTAVCNPADQFAKWHGSAVAAERMLDGAFITLRIDARHISPREALESMGMATLPEYEAQQVQYKIWNRESDRKKAPEQTKE